MIRRTIVLVAFCLLCGLCAVESAHAVPGHVNFQGRLVDGTNLLQGSHTVILDVYSSPISTNILYRETDSVTCVDGFYTTRFGNNAAGAGSISGGPPPQPLYGSFPGLLTGESTLYLEITVDGTTLSPREQLLSAPYALVSGTANGVADGAIDADALATGLRNSLDSANGSLTNALWIDDSGNVGIGATNLYAQVHIAGGADVFDPVYVGVIRDDWSYVWSTNLQGAVSVASDGTYAYVAGQYDDAITIINISDPENPTFEADIMDERDGYSYLDGVRSLVKSGDYLYAAAETDSAVTIIDVSTPSSPVKVAELVDNLSGYNNLSGARQVYRSGDLLFIVGTYDAGLTIVDVSDPTSPSLQDQVSDGTGAFTNLAGAYGVCVEGDYAYVAAYSDNSLTVIDISDPTDMQWVAEITQGVDGVTGFARPCSLDIRNGYLYVVCEQSATLSIIDVSTPSAPQIVRQIEDNSSGFNGLYWPAKCRVFGDTLVVLSELEDAVTLADLTIPDLPRVVASFRDEAEDYDYLDSPGGVEITGDLLLLAAKNDDALTLVNIAATNTEGQVGLFVEERLGVGTSSPRESLDVSGSIIASGDIIAEGDFEARGEIVLNQYRSGYGGHNIRVNSAGELYANETRQVEIAIPPCEFRPGTSELGVYKYSTATYASMDGGTNFLYAPVHMPSGSIIDAVYVRYKDYDSSNNLHFRLERQNENNESTEVICSFTTSGTSSQVFQTNLLDSAGAISNGDISNYGYTYRLRISPFVFLGHTWTDNLRIYSVTIRCDDDD